MSETNEWQLSEWQLCPKCLGEGRLNNYSTTSSVFRTCEMCYGQMKIVKPIIFQQNDKMFTKDQVDYLLNDALVGILLTKKYEVDKNTNGIAQFVIELIEQYKSIQLKVKSNCCNDEVEIKFEQEGTCYHECTKCKKPCDMTMIPDLPKSLYLPDDKQISLVYKEKYGIETDNFYEGAKWMRDFIKRKD